MTDHNSPFPDNDESELEESAGLACILSFNANDPSGAGGLTSDATAMASVGAHCLPICTGAYVRDTSSITDFYPLDEEAVHDQARAVAEDMPVQVIKVGFAGTPENLATIAELADDYDGVPVVAYMPNLSWWEEDKIDAYLDAFRELLLPQTSVLVGHHSTLRRWLLPEWTGERNPGPRDIAKAAAELGVPYTLVTGMPLPEQYIDNVLASPETVLGHEKFERIEAIFVGAGDTLTAALDFAPTVLILTPVLMPLVREAGIDPVYFGVLFIMNNAIGLLTPPVGTVLNVVCGVGRIPMHDVIRGVMPFLISQVVVMGSSAGIGLALAEALAQAGAHVILNGRTASKVEAAAHTLKAQNLSVSTSVDLTMKSVVCHSAKDLRIENTELPALGEHQLRVNVAYGGICGSDLHYYQHGGFGTVRIKQPIALGHEVSGVVDGLGSQASGIAKGQRIAISPSRPCGHCRFCQAGQHNHCLNMRFYGSAMPFPHIQGAFSEQIIIEGYQAHPIADHLSLSEAALAEPLSVGLHAIQRAGSVLGKQVLVTGCGPIGSLLIGALRRAGAARIVAADIADLPLKCAKEMGADETINLKSDAAALDKYKVDKGQFDVVFEASGSEAALRVGLDTIVPRGVLITVGMGGDISLPMTQVVAKEVDLRGTFRFHAEFATAVRFLNEGLVNGKPVITGILPVERAIEAFDLAADKSQSLKVQIAFADAA
eukprot:gene19381-22033_t